MEKYLIFSGLRQSWRFTASFITKLLIGKIVLDIDSGVAESTVVLKENDYDSWAEQSSLLFYSLTERVVNSSFSEEH